MAGPAAVRSAARRAVVRRDDGSGAPPLADQVGAPIWDVAAGTRMVAVSLIASAVPGVLRFEADRGPKGSAAPLAPGPMA